MVRAGDPDAPAIDTAGESLRRLLLPGDAPFHVVELVGLATDFLESWQHEGFEALYVLAGPIEVEIDGTLTAVVQVPDLRVGELVEQPEPGAPFGAKGVGEPPTISSTPAVVAAVRAATGLALVRTPIRPSDIALADAPTET